MLGRSVEISLYNSIVNLEIDKNMKSLWIKQLNLGFCYKDLFHQFFEYSNDKSMSRVWILLSKMANISTCESGEKIFEIAVNLEKNRQLTEKRDALIKAQRYKIAFLGAITSIFLGIISGLAPLFSTFISLLRNSGISDIALKIIPFSLYSISILSTYFICDIGLGKFNLKFFIFSSIAYLISYFVAKGIISFIL